MLSLFERGRESDAAVLLFQEPKTRRGSGCILRCEAQVKSDHVDSEVHRKNGKSTCAV
jgi:hypothetical protein